MPDDERLQLALQVLEVHHHSKMPMLIHDERFVTIAM